MKPIVYTFAIIALLAFSSCNKCAECTSYDDQGLLLDQGSFCGPNAEVERGVDDFKDYNQRQGRTSTCVYD